MAEQADKQKADKKPLNLGLIFKALFVVVNLGVTGGGAYMVYASTLGWRHPQITEDDLMRGIASTQDEELAPYIYTMDAFTVNLGGSPARTIRLVVNLEMLAKDGFEEVINVENRAKARDQIVRVLNSTTYAELETIQGKLFLKDKIAQDVNSVLKTGVVKDVFFSEFVVQASSL